MLFDEENALCTTRSIDLKEDNIPRLLAIIHRLWIIVWIFALIYCKSEFILLML